ncbi:transmembrane protein, putative, partial [Bodo saltans]
ILYIADEGTDRVRALDLITYRVSTLTGSANGYRDGPFASALFNQPCDVHYFRSSVSSVLYINQYLNNVVRKADFNTGLVTTAASLGGPVFGCLNRNGTLYFLATTVETIVRVDTATGAAVTVAGANGVPAFKDGVGTAARFNSPGGLAFNADETALYVGDRGNRRLRRIELSNMNVTTVAGTGVSSSINNVLLASTFQSFGMMLWHCDRPSAVCGVMAVEYAAVGNIRWIPISRGTMTLSILTATGEATMSSTLSKTLRTTISKSPRPSQSPTIMPTPESTASPSQTESLASSKTFSPSADRVSVTTSFAQSDSVSSTPQLSLTTAVSLSTSVDVSTSNSRVASPSQSFSPNHTTSTSIVRWTTHTLVESNEASLTRSDTKESATPRLSLSHVGTISTSVCVSHSFSRTSSPSFSFSPNRTTSASIIRWTTHTIAESDEASLTRSVSLQTWTGDATVTLSRWPSSTNVLSLSRATSNTNSASPTPTVHHTPTLLLQRTSSSSPSKSMSMTPSSSSTSEASTTKSPPTRSKSSTLFDCNALAPQTTGVALTNVNTSVLALEMQLPFLANASSQFVRLDHTNNASYPLHDEDHEKNPLLVFLSSQDVDRITLLRALPLVFNLTLASPYQLLYYYVGNVTTVLGTNVSATWSVHPRSGVWHGVVVEAPSTGWVGDVVFPVLLYRELNLLVPLMCGDGQSMQTVPSPGVPRILASEVRRATQAALIAALLATGALSGSALGRILATDSMVLCDADAAGGGGVIELELSICIESPDLIEARRAIVSNAVVVAAVCALLLFFSALWSAVTHLRCFAITSGATRMKLTITNAALRTFLLPSSLLPMFTSIIPSTSVSTTFLAARINSSPCVGVDALLIFLGVVLIITPLAALLFLAFAAETRWTCVAEAAEGGARTKGTLTTLRVAVQRAWKWHATNADDVNALRPAWVVLLEYRVLSYAAIDALFLIAVSSLALVGGLDVTNEALCRGCSAAVVVLLGAQVGVLCAWRPYTTLFSLVYNVATTALTCVSVAAQLAFVLTSFTSTSGLWLVDASAVCNLLVLGLSVVKMLLDAWELWSAVRRRIDAICGVEQYAREDAAHDAGNTANDCSDVGINMAGETHSLSLLMEDVVSRAETTSPLYHGVSAMFSDFMFWDDGGRAIGTSHAEELNEIVTTAVGTVEAHHRKVRLLGWNIV